MSTNVEEPRLSFKNIYCEPTKDEYSVCSLPFRVEIEIDSETTQESNAVREFQEFQERIDHLRDRLRSLPVGEYNAIFCKLSHESVKRGTSTMAVTYTLYHLNTL